MTAQSPPKAYNRLSQTIPAIKGLAILMIVAYHFLGYSKGYLLFSEIVANARGEDLKGWVEGLLTIVCMMGEYGVHFFLIASGFGLAASWWSKYGTPEREARPFSVQSFWRRRLLRIFPLYWLAHGLALILVLIHPSWQPFGIQVWSQGLWQIGEALIASLTTLRNLNLNYYFFLNGTWWYVGLSVQLYLVFPLLIWLGKRWGWSNLLTGSLLISLVYRAFIIALPLNDKATDVFVRGALFPSRLFEFVLGMILAIALLEEKLPQPRGIFNHLGVWSKTLLLERQWLALTGLLWIVGLGCDWASAEGWMILRVPADALIGVGEFCCVFQLLSLVPAVTRWLGLVGNHCYGIYLTHGNLFLGLWAMLATPVSNYWVRLAAVTVIACLLGGLFEETYSWAEKRLPMKKKMA